MTSCEKNYFKKDFDVLVDLDAIDIHDNGLLVPPGYNGITFWNDIFLNPADDVPGSTSTMQLIGHELTHSAQYGILNNNPGGSFIPRYIDGYLVGRVQGLNHDQAYSRNAFEYDAYNMGAKIAADLAANGNPCDCDGK